MNTLYRQYRNVRKNDFIDSVAILVSGTVVSQTIIVALTPLLTRMYSPEDFGILSVYLSIMLTIAILTSLHYEAAIPLPKDEGDAFHLLVLSFVILLVNVLLSIGLLLGFKTMLISLVQINGFDQMIRFLPFSILGFGLFQLFQLWLLRLEDYPQLTKGRVRMNVSQILAQLGLGLIVKSSSGLMAGEVIGRLAGGGGMVRASWQEIKQMRHVISIKGIWKMAVRYRRFPLIASWSSLLNGVTQHLPTFFIAYVLGVKAAGWYLIANRILALPDALLGNSVKQVFFAKSAKVMHISFSAFVSLFWQTVRKMTFISFAVYLPLILLSPVVFPFVFGDDWAGAGIFVQCMSVFFICHLITAPISAIFTLLEAQLIQVMCELMKALMLVASMVVAYVYVEKSWQIVLIVSVAQALGSIVLGLFSWYVLARKQKNIQLTRGTAYGTIDQQSQ